MSDTSKGRTLSRQVSQILEFPYEVHGCSLGLCLPIPGLLHKIVRTSAVLRTIPNRRDWPRVDVVRAEFAVTMTMKVTSVQRESFAASFVQQYSIVSDSGCQLEHCEKMRTSTTKLCSSGAMQDTTKTFIECRTDHKHSGWLALKRLSVTFDSPAFLRPARSMLAQTTAVERAAETICQNVYDTVSSTPFTETLSVKACGCRVHHSSWLQVWSTDRPRW